MATTISTPAPTPILSVRVRPPLLHKQPEFRQSALHAPNNTRDRHITFYFHLHTVTFIEAYPVASRYKEWVCGSWLAGTAGSNPAGGVDVCLSLVTVVFGHVEVSVTD
jgi:hypothetical protein